MSDKEITLRLQRPHLLEHFDDITPDFLRDWAHIAGQGQYFTGNFNSYIPPFLGLARGQRHPSLKEEDVQKVIMELDIDTGKLKELFENHYETSKRNVEAQNNISGKKRVSNALRQEAKESFKQAVDKGVDVEVAILPIYKKLRALGYDAATLGR